ncbi:MULTISPECIES: ATP-grasp domain-containing protein [Burkholderia cepacia complex]|uniref:ATP-grasp domain-containing protein n=1 Tax=Burkholderia cepacia complex TaxID=87882 RepID=UPI001E5A40D4|nr:MULTISPECIES: ATP-grasp domain-containing protein [Burkholderia cepacia complex]
MIIQWQESCPSGVLVQVKADGTLDREEAMIAAAAVARGIPIIKASDKQVERGKVLATADHVAVGSVAFVRSALRRLGQRLPPHEPYPEPLHHLLYRKVSKLPSLNDAKLLVRNGKKLFIKPAGWKRFTGFVVEFEDDIRFNGASGRQPVWIADPVRFVSEWRAYVACGQLLALCLADHGGDVNAIPDRTIIENAIQRLTATLGTPAGYVIDFGVLDSGETALIEMNDGFSFGAYAGVSPEVYWAVTVSRWAELVARDPELQ